MCWNLQWNTDPGVSKLAGYHAVPLHTIPLMCCWQRTVQAGRRCTTLRNSPGTCTPMCLTRFSCNSSYSHSYSSSWTASGGSNGGGISCSLQLRHIDASGEFEKELRRLVRPSARVLGREGRGPVTPGVAPRSR